MKFIKKYKPFISDMILNTIGFAIYIFSQQILLLPIIKKLVNDSVYANVVLYISILNVICNATGGELGNIRLIRDSDYKGKKNIGDFTRILVVLSPIIAVIVFVICIYLKYSILGSVFLSITILMTNVRLYATCYYRLIDKFKKVIIQNVIYLVGIIFSLFIFYFYKNIYILLFIPEFISLIYALKNSDLIEMRLTKTDEFKETTKKYFKFAELSLLSNLMIYFDRFLIYPMFEATLLASYYAVNSVSKIASLLTNPISSAILSWVSKIRDENSKNKILKVTLLSSIPIMIIVTIITIPLTYISLIILYNDLINNAAFLIIPISILSGLGVVISLIKAVILKFCNTNKLLLIYIIYFFVFSISGYYESKINGLIGFIGASMFSKIILLISSIIILMTCKDKKVDEQK